MNSISPYQLIEKLPPGRFGQTYRARDTIHNRPVALKVVNKRWWQNNRQFENKLTEHIEKLYQLYHPGIVPYYDYNFDKVAEVFYLVTPFIGLPAIDANSTENRTTPSGNLSAYKASVSDDLTIRRILTLGQMIAEALVYAHGEGIYHGHIKPESVLMTGDSRQRRPVLTDFGLPLLPGPHDDRPTPLEHDRFVSPEQRPGYLGKITAQTDIYLLGKLLDWLGEPTNKVTENVVPSDNQRALKPLVEKMISPFKKDQFDDMVQVLNAIREMAERGGVNLAVAEATTAVSSTPTSLPESTAPTPTETAPKKEMLFSTMPNQPREIKLFDALPTAPSLQPGETIAIGNSIGDVKIKDDRLRDPHLLLGRTMTGWLVTSLHEQAVVCLDDRQLLAGQPEEWLPNQLLSLGNQESIAAVLHLQGETKIKSRASAPLYIKSVGNNANRLILTESNKIFELPLIVGNQSIQSLFVQLRRHLHWGEQNANEADIQVALEPGTVSIKPGEIKDAKLKVSVGKNPKLKRLKYTIEAISLGRDGDRAERLNGEIELQLADQPIFSLAPANLLERQLATLTVRNPGLEKQAYTLWIKPENDDLKFMEFEPKKTVGSEETQVTSNSGNDRSGSLNGKHLHDPTVSHLGRRVTDSAAVRKYRNAVKDWGKLQNFLQKVGISANTQQSSQPALLPNNFLKNKEITTPFGEKLCEVPAHGDIEVDLFATAAPRPIFLLLPQKRPFSIVAQSEKKNQGEVEKEQIVAQGVVSVNPWVPLWLFYTLTAVLILFCIGYLLSFWRATALTRSPERQAAATARALAQFDDDGDGLNNYDELFTYQTDPHNVDSDGDGVNDFEEVNRAGHDPNNPLFPTQTAPPAATFTATPGPTATAPFPAMPAPIGTPPPPPTPLYSLPGQDILLVNAIRVTNGPLRVGDSGDNQQLQVIISFDTSLPPRANLTGGMLQLNLQKAIPAGWPLGPLTVDVAKTMDFDQETAVLRAATFTFANDTAVATLPAAALQAFNLQGITYFRLSFDLTTNVDKHEDSLEIIGSQAEENQPRLELVYALPLESAP